MSSINDSLCKTKPVTIQQFLDSPRYIGEVKIWPRIREDLIRLLSDQTSYNRALFIQPPGSGKTFLGALFLMFCLYKLGNLINPQKFFGIDETTSIGVLNMSISSRTASATLYSKLRNMLIGSPWFRKYCPVNTKIRTQIRLPKPLFAFAGNSSESFPAGYDIYGSLVDEVTMFLNKSHRGAYSDQVQNIFEVLEERAETRFMDDGYVLALGASSYSNDFVEDMIKQAQVDPAILVVRRPLWFNLPRSRYTGEYFLFDTDDMKPVSKSRSNGLFTRDNMDEVVSQIQEGIPVVPRAASVAAVRKNVKKVVQSSVSSTDRVLVNMAAV